MTSEQVRQILSERLLAGFSSKYGLELVDLASHAALPVAIDVHLLHLIRLNFFSKLPYTAESDLLLSPLCAAIGDELYEIAPNTRTLLLQKLFERHTSEHIQRLAALLWDYSTAEETFENEHLARAQKLTALSFLDPQRALTWLEEAEASEREGRYTAAGARDWFVAMHAELRLQEGSRVKAEKAPPADQIDDALSLIDEAEKWQAVGDPEEARLYLEQALAIREQQAGPDHPDTAAVLNKLGLLLQAMDDYQAARSAFERALTIRDNQLDPDHLLAANSLSNLGMLLKVMGEYEEAQPYLERALDIRESLLGPDNLDTAKSLNNLALLLQDRGDYEEARPYFERALDIHEKQLGPEDPDTALSLSNLALLLKELGDYEEALAYLERALAILEKQLGSNHLQTATILNNLGALLWDMGDYEGAQPVYERELAIREKIFGPDDPQTATSLNDLGMLLKDMDDFAQAQPYFERALAIREKQLGPDDLLTATSLSNMGVLWHDMGKYAAARPYLERAVAIREKQLGPEDPQTTESLTDLGMLLQDMGDLEAAQQYIDLAEEELEEAPVHLPLFAIPDRRDPNFTGREKELQWIEEKLRNGRGVVTLGIVGPAGVGKTTLALEFCLRQRNSYDVVFWLRAHDEASLDDDMARLGQTLGLPTTQIAGQEQNYSPLLEWLERSKLRLLLVYDGADLIELRVLNKYIPIASNAHILITSRIRDWSGIDIDLTQLNTVDLQTIELEDFIDNNYSLAELRDLCFNLGLDFNDLEGTVKGEKTRNLVEYFALLQRLDDLYIELAWERPQPYLATFLKSDLPSDQLDQFVDYYLKSLKYVQEAGDQRTEAVRLDYLGHACFKIDAFERAVEYYQRVLPIMEELDDRAGQATTLNNIGEAIYALGQAGEALKSYQRALPIMEEVGDRAGQVQTFINLSQVYARLGQFEKSAETALALARLSPEEDYLHFRAAAQAYVRAAQEHEEREPRLISDDAIARLWDLAARYFDQGMIDDKQLILQSQREARRLRHWPEIVLAIQAERQLLVDRWDALIVRIKNIGYGVARHTSVKIVEGEFEGKLDTQIFVGILPGRSELFRLNIRPRSAGSLVPLHIRISYMRTDQEIVERDLSIEIPVIDYDSKSTTSEGEMRRRKPITLHRDEAYGDETQKAQTIVVDGDYITVGAAGDAQSINQKGGDKASSVDMIDAPVAPVRGRLGLSTVEVVELLVELRHKDQPSVWDGRIPYLGLNPFHESDAQFFFGRDSLVDELLQQVGQSNFLVIGGPPVSGKSSLTRAGLFRALREGRLEQSNRWLLATMQPKDNPLEQLANSIFRLAKTPMAGEYVLKEGMHNPQALYRQIETMLTDDPRQRFVLLVDQFEEVFTETKDEKVRAAFIDLLTTAALTEGGRAIIVLTFRSDSNDRLTRYSELSSLMTRQPIRVDPMAARELAKAIILPALEVGVEIEPDLVAQIIDDIAEEPAPLLLMSFILRDLFQAQKTKKGEPMTLTLEAYLSRGGIDNARKQVFL